MADRPVSVAQCAGLGVLGFGLGGALAFSLGDAMVLGFLLQGALGGGLLGLATRSHREALTIAGLAAGASFAGHTGALFVVLTVWEPPFPRLFLGAVPGAVLGVALGLRSAGPVGGLIAAAAGAVGYGAGAVIGYGGWGSGPPAWLAGVPFVLRGGLYGALGGLLLGLAWAYCERRALRGRTEPGDPAAC